MTPRHRERLARACRTGILAAGLIAGGSCSKAEKVDASKAPGATMSPSGEVQMPFDPEYPLVVESPDKLFLPGALRRIQELMARKGYLKQFEEEPLGSRTQSAIASFQTDHDLAATGFPDGLTIRKLGFGPDEIYKKPPDPLQAEIFRAELKENEVENETGTGDGSSDSGRTDG
jgi:hypothetical protein